MTITPTSLVDILQWRAKHQPNQLAYRFLTDGEHEEVCITYKELDQRARSIGATLQTATKTGDRALLLFPAGLDFIVAYFACLYAGIIAIPLYPPHAARLGKTLATSLRIARDARPAVVLLSSSLLKAISAQPVIKDKFGKIQWLAIDKESINNDWSEKWQQPQIGENDLAFIQYTSGSTSLPKGVMISHRNLLHNLNLIEESMELSIKSQTVFWLPLYHDMGFIAGILQPLYTGYPVTLIPHLLFLQRPIRWLAAISRYQATASGGPNFAYELCLRKIKPEQRDQLDLSHWEVAFNGAEQVYHKTLDRFADYFAPCGFRREAFYPCYGLAEATLMVSGGPKERLPIMKNLIKSALEKNKVITSPEKNKDTQTVVSCGQNISRQNIKIIDPITQNLCPPDQIGEVWVSGPSVASGYWNKPLATASTFGNQLPEKEEGSFLRTGDLGFMSDGELFITGRLKNLIIIDGKNHYPHDIERTVEKSHSAIMPAGCAVFSIENAGTEQIIIMAEIQHKLIENGAAVIKEIRKRVAEQHELIVHDIKLLLPGSIPRTTSGKIRHFLCKKDYTSMTLKEITLP